MSKGWTYISAALDLCQRLGFHRASGHKHAESPSQSIQAHLFWTVYRYERSLALRIDRSSNIRDADITLQVDPADAHPSKIGKLHGQVYDQLYSRAALSQSTYEQRHQAVELLSKEWRELIEAQCDEIAECQRQSEPSLQANQNGQRPQISACSGTECKVNSMRLLYLQFDLVCHYSSLALVLRAVQPPTNAFCDVSDDCAAVARHALEIHEQYMDILRRYNTDYSLVTKYISW